MNFQNFGMKNYVSIRFEHLGGADAQNIAEENLRAREPRHTKIEKPNIEFKSFVSPVLNKDLQVAEQKQNWFGDSKLKAAIKRELRKSSEAQKERFTTINKRKWQANQVLYTSGIISFSPEQLEDYAKTHENWRNELNEWGEKFIKTWAAYHGVEPLYMVLHLDETTPHLHFMLENINDKGRSARKGYDRKILSKAQDLAGKAFASMGFERGRSKAETGATHQDAVAYEKQLLQNVYKVQEEEIENLWSIERTIEKAQEEKEQIQEYLRQLRKTREERKKAEAEDAIAEIERRTEVDLNRKKLKELKERIKTLTEIKEELEGVVEKAKTAEEKKNKAEAAAEAAEKRKEKAEAEAAALESDNKMLRYVKSKLQKMKTMDLKELCTEFRKADYNNGGRVLSADDISIYITEMCKITGYNKNNVKNLIITAVNKELQERELENQENSQDEELEMEI